MLFGVNLGRKALFPSTTFFGKEADERYNAAKTNLGEPYSDEEWEGGPNKRTPQFKIEGCKYQWPLNDDSLKGITQIVRYYYKNNNGKTMVKTWRLK
jgi:hypothetical protein